jgi:hypothetical protein
MAGPLAVNPTQEASDAEDDVVQPVAEGETGDPGAARCALAMPATTSVEYRATCCAVRVHLMEMGKAWRSLIWERSSASQP